MNARQVCLYLDKRGAVKGDLEFLKKMIRSLEDDVWVHGYLTCVKHTKKRRMLEERRHQKETSKFLDVLSDLTHDKNITENE